MKILIYVLYVLTMTEPQRGLTHFITCNRELNMKMETKTHCPLTPLINTSDFQVRLWCQQYGRNWLHSPEVRPFSFPFSRFRVHKAFFQTVLNAIYCFVKLFCILFCKTFLYIYSLIANISKRNYSFRLFWPKVTVWRN